MRRCLICGRGEDDRLHQGEAGERSSDVGPRFDQHDFDPGERRKAIRRMNDRIAVIERSLGQK